MNRSDQRRSSPNIALSIAAAIVAVAAISVVGFRSAPKVSQHEALLEPDASPVAIESIAAALLDPSSTPSRVKEVRRTPSATMPAVPRATSSAIPVEGAVIAAVDGSAKARGTIDSPFDLRTALSRRATIKPGGIVLLRGGTYRGSFVSELEGSPQNPVIVRPFPGEAAVLDGDGVAATVLTIKGHDAWYVGLEVTNSDPKRRTRIVGPHPADLSRTKANGIDVFGKRAKVINSLIHDNGNGIGFWRDSEDAEIYGSLIFNNGWVGGDGGWGHAVYAQNQRGTKRLTDNVVFNNFGYGVHVFGTEGPTIGFVVEGLTSFENGAPAGERNPNIFVGTKRQPPDRIVVRSNVVYDRPAVYAPNLRLGFATVRNKKIVVQRNLVVGGSPAFEMRNWQNVQVLDNTVVTRHDRAEDRRVLVDLKTDEIGAVTRAGRYVWKRNAYFDECGSACGASAPSSFMFNARNTKDILTFKEWRQKSKLDSESAYTPARRRSTQVVVRPNRYEIGRAFITVLNWQGSRSVLVDPSGAGLRPGSHFEVRDVQDPSGDPIVKGTWTGGPIRIPLDVKRTTQPVGSGFHRVEPTPIEFGAFLLLPR